ncbi:MAG TPA: glycoside hydrolase, partial [Terriglobales bacterium]|nr:glycoside hydrolase [Terriglobales bacterium]
MHSKRFSLRFSVLVIVLISSFSLAQQITPQLYGGMKWRGIGPYRGGRTKAGVGVPSQPNVFYIAAVNGGVWKTDDFGRTWTPIFDHEPTGSVGSIAVAPSNPNVIYVGSGEGLHRPDLSWGDGIYKSTDAGKTWTHLGLRDGQQIPQIAVDPHDPNRLFVAVLGHPYGPNKERGIYRSTDGGQTFQPVLQKDENTGGSDVQLDPSNPQVVYAAMWEAREGPWENGSWAGNNGGVFKSTDGGNTWNPIMNGLPKDFVQANIGIAPGNPRRIFVSLASGRNNLGIYRSDDAGASWMKITNDPRPAARIGGGDLPVLRVDPKNPDIVYSASVVTWKSTDGGKTWTGIRGAPGGDDYQNIWINPTNPDIILIPSDQGAIITVNGGRTWSSWYNQPTSQMYHIGVDNAFPYRVCSGQQESGSACVSSRGDDGIITFREWHPVGVEEYGYATPDPNDPDMVYGGKLTRYDRRTGQVQNISPRPLRGPDFRVVRTQPVIFSPTDPKTLYFSSNVLWSTHDGGMNWEKISPDLSRKTWQVPANVGKYSSEQSAQPTDRGVIYAVAPSPVDGKVIWAGTDDGTIHVTTDGGANWNDVTPPQLGPFWKVSFIDAGHSDAATAYAAINTIRLDDPRPHIYRTHDGGKTWTEITNGIPANENTNAVREDPRKKGLLFAGTERAVYVSFDDGDHWLPLRQNMPASSVRDVMVKDDDLIAATHGRGFWILDDITPLRQISTQMMSGPAYLFAPQVATRVRWDMNTDTPIPPDYAAGQNPPDGAIIDYYIKSGSGPVTLEILDAGGNVVRRYSSNDRVPPVDPMLAVPKYWPRPETALPADAGMHRWTWDLRYPPMPEPTRRDYPMQAVYENTPVSPTAPWAMPGQYTVRLTAGGQTYTQPLTVRMDPRVKTSQADLQQQFDLAKPLYQAAMTLAPATSQLSSIRAQVRQL